MEEKTVIVKIIGLVIGAAVLAAGVFYTVKEKDDRESRRIYTAVGAIGAAVAAVCALLLIF